IRRGARAPAGLARTTIRPSMGNGLDTIFKAYDVRGVYPDEIDEDVARRVGNAFAVFTGAERIVVAYDMRPSSVPLSAAFVDVSRLAPMTVVADTANGMGGLVVPRVFDGLPFDLTVLFPELDGTFPNHPADPIQAENLRDLQAAVREKRADIGLAFDGDADRVFLVDDQAEPLSGSLTTSIVAKGILATHPGETVVHNLICSRAVPDIIREMGGTPVRTRVGHSFIKAVMAETGAIFGGEHSGHYYFRDNWR